VIEADYTLTGFVDCELKFSVSTLSASSSKSSFSGPVKQKNSGAIFTGPGGTLFTGDTV
jgi:hypothetical protein